MTTELLSFRLSGTELEWLESQRLKGESLNLTAKRLLLGLMSTPVDTPVDTTVDTQTELESRIEKKIESRLEEMYHQISNNLNYILDKRLGYEQQPVDSVNTPVDTQTDTPIKPLESYTVIQLRVIAKNQGIPYKVRDNKAKLIELLSAGKEHQTP